MNKISFLGLGAMGERMARSLSRAGYKLTVFNRSADRAASLVELGARSFDTPRDAVSDSDIVISMVTDDGASRAIWLDEHHGALNGIKKGHICIEMSTVTPAWARELAARVREAGGEFVDAPVVGSRPQAESGQLTILAGGDRHVVDQVDHVFSTLATATHYMGPTGAGATTKLLVNFLFATQIAAMAELLALSRSSGLEDAAIASLLGALPVTSPAAAGALKMMAAGTYSPMFPIDLVIKDIGYFESLAIGAQVTTPVAAAIRGLYEKASAAGFGGDNIHGVVQAYTA